MASSTISTRAGVGNLNASAPSPMATKTISSLGSSGMTMNRRSDATVTESAATALRIV